MRKSLFVISLMVSSVAFAVPTYPTFNQAERLIGAVKEAQGDPAAYTAAVHKTSTVYSGPTFSQFERLIKVVRDGTNGTATVSGSRYLSIWDCTTGKPLDNMSSTTYRKGDIYVVGKASTNSGEVVKYYKHVIRLNGRNHGSLPEDNNYVTNVVFELINKHASAYTTADGVARGLDEAGYSQKLAGLRNIAGEWFIGTGVSQSIFSATGRDYDGSQYAVEFQDNGLGSNFVLLDADYLLDTVSECAPLSQYEHSIVASGYTAGDYVTVPNSYAGLTFTITNELAAPFAPTNDMFETAYYIAKAGSSYPSYRLPVAAGSVWTNEHTVSVPVMSAWGEPSRSFPSYVSLLPDGAATAEPYSAFAATNITVIADTVVDVTDDIHSGESRGNRCPSGASYVAGSTSGTVETNRVNAGDVYWYDGSAWRLISAYGEISTVVSNTVSAWAVKGAAVDTGVSVVPAVGGLSVGGSSVKARILSASYALKTNFFPSAEYMTNKIVSITGIHQGEPNVKLQYDKGYMTNLVYSATDYTVAIGSNARATETASSSQSIAIGRDALSIGSATVAVGPNAFAQQAQSIAMGWRANAVGTHAIAIGSAKMSGQDYYKDGVVNTNADLNLAEGDYSIAMGFNTKATGKDSIALGDYAKAAAVGAVQLGYGTNDVAHTLKFEDTTIVKDGQVVGTAYKEPESVDPAPEPGMEEMEITLKPGTMVTAMPSNAFGAGTELALQSSGSRNYTFYLPNVANVREGLPVNVMFELSAGVEHIMLGSNICTRLPIRFKSEQPYGGLAVMEVTPMDDGYDWRPVVTNCNLVYKLLENKFCCTNGVQSSVQGTSLHCATVYKMAYPREDSTTNEVPLMTLSPGKAVLDTTFYGYAGTVEYVHTGTAPAIVDDEITATITYATAYGSTNFVAKIPVVE